MAYGKREEPKLFNDEQMRQFVADGYVVFIPEVPEEVHKTVREKLQFMEDEEFNFGNNVLPRVPEMDRILNSPEVRGALISVLSPGYIEHPHRHSHYIAPDAEEKTVASNCHQDSYSPLGRPRQHYPRFARIMYYPQDSPVEIGPTHAIPGTQYHKQLSDEDRHNAIPIAGKAGTVSITHFDIGHAAGVNKINKPRHMIKFIYTRAEEPREPSWDCQDQTWRNPEYFEAPHNLRLVWSHVWDWLCGKKERYESFRVLNIDEDDEALEAMNSDDLDTRISAMHSIAARGEIKAIPSLISRLNSGPQWERVTAVYTLGALGQPAIEPLITALKDSANDNGGGDPMTKFWKETAISMDDATHALSAIGAPSLNSLIDLLDDTNTWVRINAAFALGEMDSTATKAIPALTRCLDDESHSVVRTAADTLGIIRQNHEKFMPSLGRLLKVGRPEWQTPALRSWSPNDQVRVNAAMAFTRLGKEASSSEELLLDKLSDPNGHVAAFVLEALRRIGTSSAMEGVIEYLMTRRWDEGIIKGRMY
jgi:HEAT repeat protein